MALFGLGSGGSGGPGGPGASRGSSGSVPAGPRRVATIAFVLLVTGVMGIMAAIAAIGAASPTVNQRWSAYVERLKPEARLVVAGSSQRYTASREFSARLLELVHVKASIELSAWADVSYTVDLSDPATWTVAWNPRTRALTLGVPALTFLPPAVRTETIEIRTKGANLLSATMFRLKDEAARMRDTLSADLAAQVARTLADPAIQETARSGVAKFGAAFCRAAFRAEPASVTVTFGK